MAQDLRIKLSKIREDGDIEPGIFEELLIDTYRLLDSQDEKDYNLCLSVICHIANIKHHDEMVKQLLYDCIIKSRVFLYNNLLYQLDSQYMPFESAQDVFLQSFYTSNKTNTTLTKSQKEIFDAFQKYKRLVVSAPTSFGKTRIIREIISHNDYKNIVLIMPTVSLLSEQYQELKNNVEDYIISKSSKINIDDSRKYILVLTPERMISFLEENPDFEIDFFVMDEIYKVDYKLDDDRFRVFSDILYRLAKSSAHFYLIGPYISGFSSKFLELFDVTLKKYQYEIVQKDFYHLDYQKNKGLQKIEGNNVRIIGDKFINLLRIVTHEPVDGKYLIYRYQKQYVEKTAKKFLDIWPVKPHNNELVEYLERTVSKKWDLVDCIKRGVAFHHGAMPRHIQDLIVDEFNDTSENGINYLFCTTSLTEGINTAAKNVIIYDKKIGAGESLKTLDRKNIEGRAGRFLRHFLGRVFYLEEPNQTEEETNVEIEFLDSDTPSIESLVQIDDNDIPINRKSIKDEFIAKLEEEGIPQFIIRSNKFVRIDGQLRLIKHLRKEDNLHFYHFQGSLPDKESLKHILSIIYDYLFTDRDKGRNYNNEIGKSILLSLTSYHIYHSPTFKQFLDTDIVQNARTSENARIRYVFDLTSKYFEFVWPRYVKAFENIYNFVASTTNNEHLDLDILIAQLEYGTTKPHEIILKDSGLPNDIIKKVSHHFTGSNTFEEIQNIKALKYNSIKQGISKIETKIIDKYI